jgi:sec-independent protein translocase protein TatA
MAWDDPVVWVLIVAVIVFLFGSTKIPSIARAIGQARREFDTSWRGVAPGATNQGTGSQSSSQPAYTPPPPVPPSQVKSYPNPSDPLVQAAQREGIDTTGKTREQIASELSWKLNQQ